MVYLLLKELLSVVESVIRVVIFSCLNEFGRNLKNNNNHILTKIKVTIIEKGRCVCGVWSVVS